MRSYHYRVYGDSPARLGATLKLVLSVLVRWLPAIVLTPVVLPCLAATAVGGPHYLYATHSQGNIQITLTNQGRFGEVVEGGLRDPFTGDLVYGLVYPRNSNISYLTGDIAVGAIVGDDTLVTSWQEFSPGAPPPRSV